MPCRDIVGMANTPDWLTQGATESKPEPATQPDWLKQGATAVETEPPARGLKGWAGDIAATALKGAVGVPEALVGLADIPTGGRVGKFLENEGGTFGFRPKQAREFITDTLNSDATKEAQRKFQEADGVWDKTKTAIQNPSLIAAAVGESLPAMGLGGVAARGLLAGTRLGQMGATGAALAGAAGEGVVGAGQQAEQIRQETKDGLLTPEQTGYAGLTGLTTAGFGALGGKIANRLGIGDVDVMLAEGAKGMARHTAQDAASRAATAAANPLVEQAALKSIPAKIIQGAISEGLLEELPQSVSEQIFQNLALGDPWHKDVDSAAVLGTLSGGAMGAGAAGYRGFVERGQPKDEGGEPSHSGRGAEIMRQALDQQLLALPAPERGVIHVGPDGTARTPAYQAPGYVGDVTDVEPKVIDPVREQVAAAAEQGGALSSAALTAIDTGLSDAMQPAPEQAPPQISLEEADARDRAAYEQFFAGFDADPVVSRYFENDDDIPDFDAASNASEEDFLRALGATDEDIQDVAIARQSTSPQSGSAVNAGAQTNESAGQSQGAGGNQAAAGQGQVTPLQPSNFTGTPAATIGQPGTTAQPGPAFGLKDAIAQIRTKKQQEAANAQAATPEAAPAAQAVPAAGTGAVEADGEGGEFSDLFDEQGRARFSNASSVKEFKKRTGLGQDGVRAIQAAIQEGRPITVDEARQADLAAQERRKAALEQSKAESEAETQRAKENATKPAEQKTLLGDYEIPGLEGAISRVRVFQQGERIEAVGLDNDTANNDLSRLVQAGQTVEQALATLYGDHGPNEAPNPSRVKRADRSGAVDSAVTGSPAPNIKAITEGSINAPQTAQAQQAGAGQQAARAGQAGARDESHLNALELRLSHERGRLRAAKTDAERATRQVTVDGIEREIAGERKFLGLAPQAASAMSDDALMQALKPDGAEKTSTAQPPISGTISPQPQAAGPALAAPEFTTIKTVHGDSVTVRTSDLQGDAPRLRQYTKAGKAKAVPAIHRDNLDLTGEKSAERAKENAKNPLFHTVTTKDGGAFASQAAAQREVNRLGLQDSHEVVEAGGGFVGRIKKTGEQHGATARNLRLADERTPGAGAAAPQPTSPTAGAPAEGVGAVEAPAQETTHNGTRIYPTKIKMGDEVKSMWAVESPDNQRRRAAGERTIGGDSLHDTIEQAKAAAEREAKRDAERQAAKAEQDAADKARKDAEAAKKADNINGFTEGMAPNTAALAAKSLDKLVRFRDKVASVREHIEAWHKDGALEVSTTQEPRIKPMSRTAFNRASQREQDAHEKRMKEAGNKTVYWVNDIDLGKTAHDYAAHLLAMEDQAQSIGSGKATEQPPQAQPITRADVTAAQQQAAAIITERIDAMTAGEVNTIARRFLPTMGVKPTVSKERNKVAVTDFTKVNPMAAAAEFGVTLPADVRRALDAEMQGMVADAGCSSSTGGYWCCRCRWKLSPCCTSSPSRRAMSAC